MNEYVTYHCNICGRIKIYNKNEEPEKGFSHPSWFNYQVYCWGDWVTAWTDDKIEQINFREFF